MQFYGTGIVFFIRKLKMELALLLHLFFSKISDFTPFGHSLPLHSGPPCCIFQSETCCIGLNILHQTKYFSAKCEPTIIVQVKTLKENLLQLKF